VESEVRKMIGLEDAQRRVRQASNSEIKYHLDWCKEDLALIENGTIIGKNLSILKEYLEALINIDEKELKRRKNYGRKR
jgi:hypothetical protein